MTCQAKPFGLAFEFMGLFRKGYVNVSSETDSIVITPDIKKLAAECNLSFGFIQVFVPNATSGITILENDPKIYEELKKRLEKQVPPSTEKRPERRSGTGKNEAHLRAQLIGHSVLIPFAEGKLQIGPWQEVVFFDFDDKVSRREFFILASGEGAAKK